MTRWFLSPRFHRRKTTFESSMTLSFTASPAPSTKRRLRPRASSKAQIIGAVQTYLIITVNGFGFLQMQIRFKNLLPSRFYYETFQFNREGTIEFLVKPKSHSWPHHHSLLWQITVAPTTKTTESSEVLIGSLSRFSWRLSGWLVMSLVFVTFREFIKQLFANIPITSRVSCELLIKICFHVIAKVDCDCDNCRWANQARD